jgi:pyruvate-ferredoxin/flavodoxin oxidoreductase
MSPPAPSPLSALSIFGDRCDVMADPRHRLRPARRQLCPGSASDFALIAHAAEPSWPGVPFLHFFDGFRTSHEVNGHRSRSPTTHLRALIDPDHIAAHRARALSPDRPVLRGTAQNPGRLLPVPRGGNPYYQARPAASCRT